MRSEAAQREREERRESLNRASLHRLNNGADADTFRDHARFHLTHLPRLTTRPEHIRDLRQTILNLAVRGKLVPQNPNDEPASSLVEHIIHEKSELVPSGKLRREKMLPPVPADDLPFAIPKNWTWSRIGTCALSTDYGTSVKSDHSIDGVPVVKMGDIQGGCVILGGQKKFHATSRTCPFYF